MVRMIFSIPMIIMSPTTAKSRTLIPPEESGPDGGLIATCFSHGCEYKQIMMVLEDMNFKPKTEFNPKQKKAFIQKKSRYQLRAALQIEMHIALQFLNDRVADNAKRSDKGYLSEGTD